MHKIFFVKSWLISSQIILATIIIVILVVIVILIIITVVVVVVLVIVVVIVAKLVDVVLIIEDGGLFFAKFVKLIDAICVHLFGWKWFASWFLDCHQSSWKYYLLLLQWEGWKLYLVTLHVSSG